MTTLDALLKRLERNGKSAGDAYIRLQRRLILYFEQKGFQNAEELADRGLDRVGQKLLDGVDIENVEAYCLTVASYVALEESRGGNARTVPLNERLDATVMAGDEPAEKERRHVCLDHCLTTLPEKDRNLVVEYYMEEKREKFAHHKRLAEQQGISSDHLRVRMHNIRKRLRDCITDCLDGKKH